MRLRVSDGVPVQGMTNFVAEEWHYLQTNAAKQEYERLSNEMS
jgi:hypothetical protein